MNSAMHAGTPPPVSGSYADERIRFPHTEASNAEVADLLTDMMGSPVVHMPALADAPDRPHGLVDVFTNGAEPRTLTSAEAVAVAERAGEVAVTEPGIVVTMPVIEWPGGQR